MKCLGWPYRAYIKTAKNGDLCESLLSENDFEVVLATFCCCDHGARASEAVQKDTQAQIGQKIKNILRISSASILSIEFCFFCFFSKVFLINRTLLI